VNRFIVPYRPVSTEHAFDVLGLVPGAMPHEVKRAYRKLAMQWHPDRNTSPEAVERFRQVRAAYDFLQSGDDVDDAPERHESPEEAPPSRGADQQETLWLTLEEAIFGGEQELSLVEARACESCEGSGSIEFGRSRLCEDCHGSGRVRTSGGLAKCEVCGGRGYVSRVDCDDCDGTGTRQAGRRVRVIVPPLMWPGRTLRLNGQAIPAEGCLPGDLLLVARLKPHALFAVVGEDVRLSMPVSAVACIAGEALRVPVPGGETTLDLAAGRPEARELRLAGQGLPRRSGGRGDLVIMLTPIWPEALAAEDLALLRTLSGHFSGAAARLMPELAQWQAQWLGSAEAGEAAGSADTSNTADSADSGEAPRKKKGKKPRADKGARSGGERKHKRKGD